MSMFDPVPYETTMEARDVMAVASGRTPQGGSGVLRDLPPIVAGTAAALEAGGAGIGRPRPTAAAEWLDPTRFEGAMLHRAVGRLLNQMHAQGAELDMTPKAMMSELAADVSLQSASGLGMLRGGGAALSHRQEQDREHVARGRFDQVSAEGRARVSEAMRDARFVPTSVVAEIDRIGRDDEPTGGASPRAMQWTARAMHAANGLGSVSEDGLDGFTRAIAAAALVLEAHPPAKLAPYGVKAESYLEPHGSLGGAALTVAAALELSPEGEAVRGKAPRDVVADMVVRVHAHEDGLDEATIRASLPKTVTTAIDEMSQATALDRSVMRGRSSYVNDRLGSFSDGVRRLFRGFVDGTEGPQAEAAQRLEELSSGRRPTDAIEHGVLAHIKAFPDEIAGHRAAARVWMLADALVDHEAPSVVSSPASVAMRTEALAAALYERRRESYDLSLARTKSMTSDQQRDLFQEVHAGEAVSPLSRGRIAMTVRAEEVMGVDRSERMSRFSDPAWLAATAAFTGTQRN